jgi:hypothetical protein
MVVNIRNGTRTETDPAEKFGVVKIKKL